MYKIMIIEDDITIAESLSAYIEKYNYEVFIVRQLEKIMDEFNEYKPDLILLDVNLPIYDGFFWCREIRNISSLPIIFISARTGDLEQIYAMDNGADDYIVKPFVLDVVIAKINANIRRAYGDYSNLTKERILNLKDLSLYCEAFILKNRDREVRLTKKEVELLSLFIENHPKVISREELLRALWDDEMFVEENTLNVNITRIRKRLTEVDARFLIESVRGVGYRLVEVE
ncbi:two component transcriptional regulator, winged helix family [Alkaliphilus metalliredigens QYMF]|uniref:Stage 0 sporulation protein A homolog n=1 Tax=Alkaliphilus metalliredigens (strain QYMF) TaxID=293826 RepID=A6TU12_ALKMQ|nr:response regulator transcription factor [Alkaliphilus metalliredigens]ABR49680.1 two component transcriptional regulator, winged helix family [Alkaliphilus metalliredigens QYMF]